MVYELDGPPGATATASYLDTTGASRDVDVSLPWTLRTTVADMTFPAGVTAASDGLDVSCRIVIDDVVRSAETGESVVGCQVPAS